MQADLANKKKYEAILNNELKKELQVAPRQQVNGMQILPKISL